MASCSNRVWKKILLQKWMSKWPKRCIYNTLSLWQRIQIIFTRNSINLEISIHSRLHIFQIQNEKQSILHFIFILWPWMTLGPCQEHDTNFRNLIIIYLSNYNFKIKVQDDLNMHEKVICKRQDVPLTWKHFFFGNKPHLAVFINV